MICRMHLFSACCSDYVTRTVLRRESTEVLKADILDHFGRQLLAAFFHDLTAAVAIHFRDHYFGQTTDFLVVTKDSGCSSDRRPFRDAARSLFLSRGEGVRRSAFAVNLPANGASVTFFNANDRRPAVTHRSAWSRASSRKAAH